MIEEHLRAQEGTFTGWNNAFKEVQNGKKESHWIWYIFPQLKGLGFSAMNEKFGLSCQTAEEYWTNNILKERLLKITKELLNHDSIYRVMGSDAIKVKSCCTLFYLVSNNPIFKQVLDKFFDGDLCVFTKNKWETYKK